MSCLVLLTNAWGPKYGGINAFNADFAKALGLFLWPDTRVLCVVPEATDAEKVDALAHKVDLIEIGLRTGELDISRIEEVATAVRGAAGEHASWWLGHDIITGEIAVELPRAVGHGRAAVIHHMSYIDYQSYKHGVGAEAKRKYERQRQIFEAADKVFAVGPLLRDRLADMLARDPGDIAMIVPGFADIESAPSPRRFKAITFGRLDPTNDRIKQGRLAVAAFATASRRAHEEPALPAALRDSPQLSAIGIAQPGGEEEDALRALAQEKAMRVIQLVALPYDDDRKRVFEDLRRSSAAMMLSWHEGFGLTGWEAIAAEVPLIVSKSSGVYQIIDEFLGGAGTGCLYVIDVRGKEGGHSTVAKFEDENFQPEDEVDAAAAILKIAAAPDRAKRDAKMLRALLSERAGCTWQDAARAFAAALELRVLNDNLTAAIIARRPESAPPPEAAERVSSADDLLEVRGPTWQPDRGLAESQLLRAEESCVPFHGSRRHVLDEVLRWARGDDGPRAAVQLRIGVGGAGKTRLMLEACAELRREGWKTGFLANRKEADRKRLQKLFTGSQRTLIVIDYAAARRPEIAAVVDAMQRIPSAHRARLMLLAREAGEWWEQLVAEQPALESFLTGRAFSGPLRIPPVPVEDGLRETVFREALAAYAKTLKRDPAGLVPPNFSPPHFAEILFLHLSALAALFGERPETATSLLDTMLRRERRYWQKAASSEGLGDDTEGAIAQAMALFTLASGTTSAAEARRMIDAVPQLREAGPMARDKGFHVLRGLYPAAGGVDALRPDVLGERLVTQELAKNDELLDILLRVGADDAISKTALTVLNRLARRSAADAIWLKRGLERHFPVRATVAASIALEAGDPIGAILAEVLEAAPDLAKQWGVLDRLRRALPMYTIALREVGLVVAKLQLDQLQSKKKLDFRDKQKLAKLYMDLESRLRDMGQLEEALDVGKSARAQLSNLEKEARGPVAHLRQAKAHSEIMLSNLLGELGLHEEGLTRAEAALAMATEVAPGARDAMRSLHAATLQSLATQLRQLGRHEESLRRADEALGICRELALKEARSGRPGIRRAVFVHRGRSSSGLWGRKLCRRGPGRASIGRAAP